MVRRREMLQGVAMVAVADKINDGGFSPVSLPGVPERGNPILPPGAVSFERFSSKCIACGVCVAECPEQVLKPSTSLKHFGLPTMDFRHGHCLLGCVRCSAVCPAGALQAIQVEMKPHVHIGAANWVKERCVRTTEGDECKACVRKCPVQAIHLVKGFPVVDQSVCIGCGACEHVCPARPEPAIYVKGFDKQRMVKPMNEDDLIAEMEHLINSGAAVVIAKNGVIHAKEFGRGLAPLLKLLDDGRLNNAIVVDKVIGRAAAAICVAGKVKRVHTLLAAEGAAELLANHGISLTAVKTVPMILNRKKTGSCPMEAAVKGLEDPAKMIEVIRITAKKLAAGG